MLRFYPLISSRERERETEGRIKEKRREGHVQSISNEEAS
jgi:hypothetical protein